MSVSLDHIQMTQVWGGYGVPKTSI